MEFIGDFLPVIMFAVLAVLLFSGLPVAVVLGGVGVGIALFAVGIDELNFRRLLLLPGRVFGGIVENLVLVAIPMFIYMGTMLERSGVANDLLHAFAGAAAPGARRARALGHAHGHDHGGDHRDHRRVGRDDDSARPAGDAEPELQHPPGDGHDRRVRHARHPDPALDHAGDHGRPPVDLGGHPVPGRDPPRADPGRALPAVHPGALRLQAPAGPPPAAGVRGAGERRRADRDGAEELRAAGAADRAGAGLDLRRLRHADRGGGRRCTGRHDPGRGQPPAELRRDEGRAGTLGADRGDAVLHLRWRHRLRLRVPGPGRRRPGDRIRRELRLRLLGHPVSC